MANNEARLPVRRQNCCAWSAWSAAQMQKTQAAPRPPPRPPTSLLAASPQQGRAFSKALTSRGRMRSKWRSWITPPGLTYVYKHITLTSILPR